MEKQDWEGKHLDKDLLVPGNKVYSPETCIFVSRRLNSFLLPEEYLINSKKSGLPLGVVFDRCGFRCQVSNTTSNNQHVKIFKTAEEAHTEWVMVKMKILEEILAMEDISENAINTIRNNLHKRMNIKWTFINN